jgi:hypothetical protein
MTWTGLQHIIGEVQDSIMTAEEEEEFMLDDLFVPERKKVQYLSECCLLVLVVYSHALSYTAVC